VSDVRRETTGRPVKSVQDLENEAAVDGKRPREDR